MTTHYVAPSDDLQGLVDNEIDYGDTIVLEEGATYPSLQCIGVKDLHITTKGESEDAYFDGPQNQQWDALFVRDCEQLVIDHVTAANCLRSLRAIDCRRCSFSVIAYTNPWTTPMLASKLNHHGIDITQSDDTFLWDCAAVGNFRKAVNNIGCLRTRIAGMYIRHEGYVVPPGAFGSPPGDPGIGGRVGSGGQGLAPNYHSWDLLCEDVLVEAGAPHDGLTYYCDLISSDHQTQTDPNAQRTFARLGVEDPVRSWWDIRFRFNRCMVVGRGSGIQSNYGMRWTQGDREKQSTGVHFADLTVDLDLGWKHAIALNGSPNRPNNVIERLDLIGPNQDINADASWDITQGVAERPRLSRSLKRRVRQATARSEWPNKVFRTPWGFRFR